MTDNTIAFTDKQSARKYFLELRKSISTDIRQDLDQSLFANTIALSAFKDSDVILCYSPVRGEPNILPIADYALKHGKKVAFPISHVKEKQLTFHEITSISDLNVGTYNIPEPSEALPKITDFSKTLCIVPALAFDCLGFRLGYGGGYYDRFLSSFNGTSLGLVYSQLYTKALPTDIFDAIVDIIVTENGGYFSNEQKRNKKTKYSSSENY